MINALKLISLNRGYDPRDFTLVAFGGGGGMHAVALAAELGIRKVVIPRAADVFSAWGMLMSDLRRDYFLTRLLDLAPDGRRPLEARARRARRRRRSTSSRARGSPPTQVRFRRYANLRYDNQEHSVEVALADGRDRRRRGRARSPSASTPPTSASTPTGSTRRSSSSARTWSRSPRSASSTPATLPATGRPLDGRRRRAPRSVDYATEGIHDGRRSTTATCSSPG